MITLSIDNTEAKVSLNYSETIGHRIKIELHGEADSSHHLVEACFDLVDKLARIEKISHQSEEWRKRGSY